MNKFMENIKKNVKIITPTQTLIEYAKYIEEEGVLERHPDVLKRMETIYPEIAKQHDNVVIFTHENAKWNTIFVPEQINNYQKEKCLELVPFLNDYKYTVYLRDPEVYYDIIDEIDQLTNYNALVGALEDRLTMNR